MFSGARNAEMVRQGRPPTPQERAMLEEKLRNIDCDAREKREQQAAGVAAQEVADEITDHAVVRQVSPPSGRCRSACCRPCAPRRAGGAPLRTACSRDTPCWRRATGLSV